MGFFSKFPYSNGYQLNLDWIIGKIKKFESDYNQLDPDSFLRKSGGELLGELKLLENALLNANGKKIVNVPFPVNSKDAANKEYVDFKIGTPEAPGAYLPLAGGAMSGKIHMDGHSVTGLPNAVNDNDALSLAFARTLFAANGYGLGVSRPPIELTNCNEGLVNGWYRVADAASNAPLDRSFWMRVDAFSDTYLCQTVYSELSGGVMCMRYYVGGTWQPWEWVNPPMNLGVEYRTIDRCNGSAVYRKRVDVGRLADSTYKSVGLGVSSRKIIKYDLLVISTGGQLRMLPFINDSKSIMATSYINDAGSLLIYSHADLSSYQGYCDIYYTN